MYEYEWDGETGGLLLKPIQQGFSNEPRPVYSRELDLLGFDRHWTYEKQDDFPYLWAEANNYIYRGRLVAKTRGGTISQPPELILIEDPEPDRAPLKPVDLPRMVEKNRELLENLVQETIKQVYNSYLKYRNKVDIFHVSFSGGKDSEVTLDIVQRAIPHSDFVVIFGDTGMEFPDTYESIDNAENRCKELGISFYRAKSVYSPCDTWNVFGPPSTTIRWCCSVHKTAPQLLRLRELTGKPDFREMAFVGVRADESIKRSNYEYITLGEKHKGQYSCYPILYWNSAEVYLYLFTANLPLNNTYKKGNSRAGCLVCPMSRDKSDYMRNINYPAECENYLAIVQKMSIKKLETHEDEIRYLETGGWKLRSSGRDIKSIPPKYKEIDDGSFIEITIISPSTNWKTWMKTIGTLIDHEDGNFTVERGNVKILFTMKKDDKTYLFRFQKPSDAASIQYVKLLKQVFHKSAYCILCRECEADCQRGCISMRNNELEIADNCIHCSNCHKPHGGCLLYQSLSFPQGTGKMNNKSIECYGDHAPKMDWMTSFFSLQNDFFDNHTLGSNMINYFKRFLRDAQLIENNKITPTMQILTRLGLDNQSTWGIMLVNLAYTPEFNWYIKNVEPDRTYSRPQLIEMLQEAGVKERGAKSITGAYKRILSLPFGEWIGLGRWTDEDKVTYYVRGHWQAYQPKVILYALYKYAEACEGYYQFSLTRLMDTEIESAGVSPAAIFGLSRDQLEEALKSLSVNHPDFITTSFALGLDTITLDREKTAMDVLELFE